MEQSVAEPACQWCSWTTLLLVLAIPLLKLAFHLVVSLLKQLIPPIDLLNKYCDPARESWAVVTGATDGIGLGFCEELTRLGFNLVLISRNPDKLKKTVEDLQAYRTAAHKDAKFMTIAFDFKDCGDEQKFSEMTAKLGNLDIALLVNNVGTSWIDPIHLFPYRQLVDIVNINVTSMVVLSAHVLRTMATRSQRSAVINLSSFMGEGALPYLSLYAGTKAFNLRFSEGVSLEYPNVDVMCLKPMFVESPLSQQKKGFGVPDRRECARDALKELRWEYETYGYISHRIIAYLLRMVPRPVARFAIKMTAKKALKKIFTDKKAQ
jgi:17beta-estradiol 17-dehydrogenase / very-long-chain 3-oxoacyl-CoA reductase